MKDWLSFELSMWKTWNPFLRVMHFKALHQADWRAKCTGKCHILVSSIFLWQPNSPNNVLRMRWSTKLALNKKWGQNHKVHNTVFYGCKTITSFSLSFLLWLVWKRERKNFYQLSSLFIVVTFVALEASSVKMDFCTPPIYNLISEAFGVFAL